MKYLQTLTGPLRMLFALALTSLSWALFAAEDAFIELGELESIIPASTFIYTAEFSDADPAAFDSNPQAFIEDRLIASIEAGAIGPLSELAWQRNSGDELILESANGLRWFYIDLRNSSPATREALLEFVNVDGVGWIYNDAFGELQLSIPSYDRYLGGRQVFDTEFVIPVEVPSEETSRLIGFTYNISSPRVAEVRVWEPEYFRAQRAGQYFGDGIYYGFLLALVLYNLTLAFIMRQFAYLYAGAFQLCVGAVIFIGTGYSTLFVFPHNQIYTVPVFGVFIVLASITSGLFSVSILQIKQFNSRLYYTWIGLITWGVLQIPIIAITGIPGGTDANSNSFLVVLNALIFIASIGIHFYTLIYFWHKVSIAKFWFVAVIVQIWVVMFWQVIGSIGFGNTEILKLTIQLFTLLNGAVLSWLISVAFRKEQRTREIAQQEALASLKMANDIQLSKANFISTAGHDLRQPLQAIRLHIEALQEQATDATGAVLNKVKHNIQELSALLNSLMNLSKSTSYVDRDSDEEFLLDEIINSLHEELEPFAKQKGIKLEMQEAPFLVRTSKVGLTQILRNLLHNGIKFTRAGKVSVEIEHTGEDICVSVIDTGAGIHEQELERIFTEHYQVFDASREDSRGMGIGLSIVKRLSEALHIPLKVESTVGQGTEFHIKLHAPNPAKVKRLANTDPTALNGLRVAIAHSDASRSAELRDTLERWGAVTLSRSDLQSLDDYTQEHGWSPHMLIVEQALFEEFSALGEQETDNSRQTHSLFLSMHIPTIVLSTDASDSGVQVFSNSRGREGKTSSRYHWFTDPLSPGVLRSFIQRVVIKPAS